MYKFYRKLWNGKWKYSEAFNSTLDPDYHDLINYCRANGIEWKLVDSSGKIKFQSQPNQK
jgi:hypothetical protein